jgi:branched-chain amino acid transport system permease protein
VGTLPLYIPAYTTILMIDVFMYIVLALSWATFCGPTRYISLAHAAFFGVGVYSSAIFQEISFPLAIILGGLLSSSLGLLVGVTTLRLRGLYFGMFTFGLSEILRHFVTWYEVNITGTVGRWLPLLRPATIYHYMLVVVVLMIVTAYALRKSKFGLALKAIGQSEEAADHIGINTRAVKIVVFSITCFFVGAAGAIVARRWSYVDADFAFAPFLSFLTIIMVLVGGIESPFYGPILGATVLTVLSDTILAEFPRLTFLLFGGVLIIVILFLPEGVAGLMKASLTRMKNKTIRSKIKD